jgi:hypothetical protein
MKPRSQMIQECLNFAELDIIAKEFSLIENQMNQLIDIYKHENKPNAECENLIYEIGKKLGANTVFESNKKLVADLYNRIDFIAKAIAENESPDRRMISEYVDVYKSKYGYLYEKEINTQDGVDRDDVTKGTKNNAPDSKFNEREFKKMLAKLNSMLKNLPPEKQKAMRNKYFKTKGDGWKADHEQKE